jgi:hypothetical protein
LNKFVEYFEDENKLVFKPSNKYLIGTHRINLLLDNNMGINSSFIFDLDVYDFPRFSKSLKKVYEIGISSKEIITLPLVEEFH